MIDRTAALERLRASVPPNVRTVCETLGNAGFQSVAVGGAVRDAILDRAPGDWDVATAATPEQVLALFKRTIPTGLQHGTVTIVTGRGVESHVEVTTFRGEGAYTDARRPDHVRFGVPLVEDLARRDLRVNAMAYDPLTHELIDPYEGLKDLEEGVLRAVGPTGNVFEDARGRFTEDGLRVMRAVRFAAKLELPLDPDTVRGITPALPSLAKVSRERVSDELRKILATKHPSLALHPAWDSGIIGLVLPALAAKLIAGERAHLDGVRDRRAVDDWANRVDRSPPDARLGALVGDLGAVANKRLDANAVKSIADVLRALKFSNDELTVASSIACALPAIETTWSDAELRRLFSDVTRPRASLAIAMWRASGNPLLAEQGAAILARGDALATSELAITGNDLMTELGMPAGPAIGKTLRALFERVLDEPALNDRTTLLGLARTL